MGITVHFINKSWELQQLTLDFIEIEGSHKGENLAKELIQILELYDIASKVYKIYHIIKDALILIANNPNIYDIFILYLIIFTIIFIVEVYHY